MSSSEYAVTWKDPGHMLRRIESDPDSFTIGRRNDDMVNWFLMMLLKYPNQDVRFYIDQFDELFDRLSPVQQGDLHTWNIDPTYKIQVLYWHYGGFGSEQSIRNLWIEQSYQLSGNIPGQLIMEEV